MTINMTQELKNAKATRGKGFGDPADCTPQAQPEVPEVDTTKAKESAIAFSGAVGDALKTQLQQKVDVISSIQKKLDSAADAIVYQEQQITSGNYLEAALANRRQQHQLTEEAQADATVAIAFEELTDGDLLTNLQPPSFPDPQKFAKLLTPAQKARLDRAVLGPAK